MSFIDELWHEQIKFSHGFLRDILQPSFGSYFYWLVLLSAFVYSLEVIFPWRRNQKRIRKDFFLDSFYMFFNMFIIHFLGFKFISSFSEKSFRELLEFVNMGWLLGDRLINLPIILHLLVLFMLRDFIQWWIHRLLHKSDTLWEFHKVHHSVEEMGYAAHLRYHWVETVIYNSLQFIPLGVLGFTLNEYLSVFIISILIGHLNHANIRLPLGPLKYLFNNPQMHIWHHTKGLPKQFEKGCNFGLSLSCWDYLFGTAYIPEDGQENKLGFKGLKDFPKNFLSQILYGFGKKKADRK